MLHSWLDHPAKHTWADCSENPANQPKKPPKREQAYYAHDTHRLASDGWSDDGYRTEPASDDKSVRSCRSSSSRCSVQLGEDNYAVAIASPRKRAKLNPPARKKKDRIAISDGSDDDDGKGLNKRGKFKDPLYLSDSE